MHSVSVAGVTRRARRASDSPAAHIPARAGLSARDVIYLPIGWVAVLVALGLAVFGSYGLSEARWRRV